MITGAALFLAGLVSGVYLYERAMKVTQDLKYKTTFSLPVETIEEVVESDEPEKRVNWTQDPDE